MDTSLSTIVVPEYLVNVKMSVEPEGNQVYDIIIDPSLLEIAEAMDVEIDNQTVSSVYEMGYLVNDYHAKITQIINRLNTFRNIKKTVFNQHEIDEVCKYGNIAQLNNLIGNIINVSKVKSFTQLDALFVQQGKKLDFVEIMEQSQEIENLKANPMYNRETFAMLHLYVEDYVEMEQTFSRLNLAVLFNKSFSSQPT